jgi:Tol biopolymer transport system component
MIQLLIAVSAVTSTADSDPDWSPDGSRVAFTRESGGLTDVWVYEPKSGQLIQVTKEGACYSPTWSRDAKTLAYSFVRGGTSELRLVPSDGRAASSLFLSTIVADAPNWSPSGDRIAFGGSNPPTAGIQIMIVDIATKRTTGLTTAGNYNSWPSWSPNGKQIAYSGTANGIQQVFVVDADGANRIQISKKDVSDIMPCWSPDGRQIAYVARRDGNAEIYAFDLATKKERRLTTLDSNEFDPAWSPDGKQICVSSDLGGKRRLYVFTLNALQSKSLTPLMKQANLLCANNRSSF